VPIFDAFVDIENVLVAPACISCFLSPMLEIVLMAPSPDHSVDAGSTAEGLAHRLMERTVVNGSTRLGGEAPIHWVGGDMVARLLRIFRKLDERRRTSRRSRTRGSILRRVRLQIGGNLS
jgi:hypothetical protein